MTKRQAQRSKSQATGQFSDCFHNHRSMSSMTKCLAIQPHAYARAEAVHFVRRSALTTSGWALGFQGHSDLHGIWEIISRGDNSRAAGAMCGRSDGSLNEHVQFDTINSYMAQLYLPHAPNLRSISSNICGEISSLLSPLTVTTKLESCLR